MIAAALLWLGLVAAANGLADEANRAGPGADADDGVPAAVLAAQAERIELAAALTPQVVCVFSPAGQDGGSGVLVTRDGWALTNYHVVAGSEPWVKCGLADGSVYDAVVAGIDPTGDVAVIKLLGRDDFPHAQWGDSDRVRAGDWALALGNPFMLATDFQPTLSYGIISGVHRYQYPAGTLLEYADCLQTDAAINPGNSGGPLFDRQGKLIGINGRCSFEKRGRVNVGVAYAISINQIRKFMSALSAGRLMDHASLGAVVTSDFQGRVVVSQILEGSDAYRRGLRVGDEIVALAGRPVQTVNGFKNVLGTLPHDWRVPLVARRGGQQVERLVRLRPVHRSGELEAQMGGGLAEGPRPRPAPQQPKPREEGPDAEPAPPPGGLPPLALARPKGPPLPEAVAAHYEPRRGFVNYYFNRQRRDELLASLAASPLARQGAWTLSGRLPDGGAVSFELDDERAAAHLPLGRFELVIDDDLGDSPEPPGSGGLLVALWLWRQLLAHGPGVFDSLHYLGEMPLGHEEQWRDVLEGFGRGVTLRIYLDRTSGSAAGLEMFPAPDVDPCEVYFSPAADAPALPGRIEIRTGDDVYGVVEHVSLTTVPGQR